MSAPIKWNDEWIIKNHSKYGTYRELAQAYEAECGERVNSDSLNAHVKLKLGINKSRNICWHDEWIISNYLEFASYAEMAEEHNRLFGTTADWRTLKNHARCKLNLRKPRMDYKPYTGEQIDWLKTNYPKLGVKKTAVAFNKRFGCDKTESAIKNFGFLYGVQVDEAVSAFNKTDPTHGTPKSAKPIGSIRKEGQRTLIKTDEGWEQIGRAVVKASGTTIPKGYSVIHLDGDTAHYDISNLMVVPTRYCGLLMAHGLRSENAQITRAGVAWCDLHDGLIKAGVKIGKGDL